MLKDDKCLKENKMGGERRKYWELKNISRVHQGLNETIYYEHYGILAKFEK
jgi:hypothetical protein